MLKIEDDDIYVGMATSGSGGGDTPGLKFLKILETSSAEVIDENTFTVEFAKELPDLSVETYLATFTFENGVLSATATKDGESVGNVGIYVQLVPYDTSMSTFQKLPALTLSDDKYVCQIGEYTCSFEISIEEDAVSLVGEYSKGGVTYGDVDLYWEIIEKEPAKGSFDSENQLLTLNYAYLVEKINASSLPAEIKEILIANLNNSDAVVDLNIDYLETFLGVSSDIAWLFPVGSAEAPAGMMAISKGNVTETALLTIPSDGGAMFGTWNSLRVVYELQGMSMTADEVEELLSPSVVDEAVFTVSGTLGNFSVEFN